MCCVYRTSRIAVRIVYCVLLISGITLENAYSGGLKALLTIPRYALACVRYAGNTDAIDALATRRYHEKITTIRQFVDRGYHWGAPQPAWAYSIRHAEVHDDRAMYDRFESQSNDRLHNLSFSRTYGIGLERLHAGSYSFGDYVRMDSLVKEEVSIYI